MSLSNLQSQKRPTPRAADLGYAPRYLDIFLALCFFRFDGESTLPPQAANASRWALRSIRQENYMEITFQNRLSDFEAFFDYMLTQTQEGKRWGEREFEIRRGMITYLLVILCLVYWGITGNGIVAFLLFLGSFALLDGILFAATKFKPGYYFGKKTYQKQTKLMTERDLQLFQVPRTMTIEDNWVEVCSSESRHRWKWGLVDSVGLTSDFIFLHVSKYFVYYIPKRDFPTEQSFIDLGKKLLELVKKNKGQTVGVGQKP